MFRSIFAKYFTVVSVVIVVSFAAMGGMQMLFSTRYWVAEKQDTLRDSARKVAAYTELNTVEGDTYRINETNVSAYINVTAETTDTVVFVTDNSGRVQLYSADASRLLKGETLPESIVRKLTDGASFFEVGTLSGVFGARQYTVGEPLLTHGGTVRLGYVFVSSPAVGLGSYLRDNLQVFALSALGVLALTFLALYVMTYRMARPLRQMASATRSFAMGDFSCRVSVHGRDEVAELAASLNNMAVSLSSVEGMRRSFVANVSHELKTPMTTIAGFIDGILDGTIPDEKRNYYLKIVSDEVKRLSRLVKSMLDLSRIDNGELRLNPVEYDMTDQVCNILLSFEKRLEDKNIRVAGLEDSPRAEVSADYDLVGQVIYNLLDNAVKFIDEGGELTLRVFHQDHRVHFLIRNTGAGIPAHEMLHIFERFYKSDKSRSLDRNGMGLGLYIVKTVVNLHHGEIVVRSVEGEYCEFEFWLPEASPSPDGRQHS